MNIRYVQDHLIDILHDVSIGPAWPWAMVHGCQVPADRYLPSVHRDFGERYRYLVQGWVCMCGDSQPC